MRHLRAPRLGSRGCRREVAGASRRSPVGQRVGSWPCCRRRGRAWRAVPGWRQVSDRRPRLTHGDGQDHAGQKPCQIVSPHCVQQACKPVGPLEPGQVSCSRVSFGPTASARQRSAPATANARAVPVRPLGAGRRVRAACPASYAVKHDPLVARYGLAVADVKAYRNANGIWSPLTWTSVPDPCGHRRQPPYGRTTGPSSRAPWSQPDSTEPGRHSGALRRRAAGSHERGDNRQGTATAACPPQQGRCVCHVAASAESASHL
jgi:hypothetical protein